ncbi:MAG: DUF1800 domain-containing protein [Pelagimonas sp.]|jgi:uncharacterized protein (DUF1800 family)|nr:DUF1800 domain-containing protein [Pelagimonas sp.]
MRFDPLLAEIRFGCGLSPDLPRAASPDAMIDGLRSPDAMAARYPIEPFETFLTRMEARRDMRKELRGKRGTPEADPIRKALKLQNKTARQDHLAWLGQHVLRRVRSTTPFRERLESFWGDHFTATGKAGVMRRATSPYLESAIRPNLAGRFSDLLIAAVTHPVMVSYLDQDRSIGPNSKRGQKAKPGRGLNENLAREILELHTLGVDGPYTQTDVRELAELLTGLTVHVRSGRHFRKDYSEPGTETVLGKTYGGDPAHFRDIESVLQDLATHPATARHLATKLAVHFCGDTPDPALVAAIETAWLDSGGDLPSAYRAMLTPPSAWDPAPGNMKQPFDFICSACRALAIPDDALQGLREGAMRRRVHEPLRMMGHSWQKPSGPDGLDEVDAAWITPQGMAARLQWAVTVPLMLRADLPDPRQFVDSALAGRATEAVRFAANAAESRADGVGLVLASPAFQRM